MSFWSQNTASAPPGAGTFNAGASSFAGQSYGAMPPAHGSPGPWGGPSSVPYGGAAPSGFYGGGQATPGASTSTASPFFASQPQPMPQPAQFGFSSSYMGQPGGFDASASQQPPSFFGGGMAPQQHFASTSKPSQGSPWGQQVRDASSRPN